MIAGLVFNCGGCGARLQVIADDKDAFAAQLENASLSAGRKIVALRNADLVRGSQRVGALRNSLLGGDAVTGFDETGLIAA